MRLSREEQDAIFPGDILRDELPELDPDVCPAGAARDNGRRRQQQFENVRLQEADVMPVAPSMNLGQMVEDAVWIADGSQVGFISNPRQVLSFHDFAGLTASCRTEIEGDDGKSRKVLNASLWKASDKRATVAARTFCAGGGAVCQDPDGNLALNSWRPISRTPGERDVSPFLDHVGYLYGDPPERAAFLDWLAHIEQRPGILPHYGWLHIAKSTGTGRNWLASVLARVWRGYVAPNVDLPGMLSGQFNGALAGRVLAIVDEVQEGGGENPYRHANKLKSLVNAEVREINPKYGRQYREWNACRWLVFSNHENALPLNDTDRRWRVVRHDGSPKSPKYYERLYALIADENFVNAVGAWLRDRDISRFNPGERPPMNSAKQAVISASKTSIMENAEQLVALWPADVITNRDLARVLSGNEQSDEEPTPAMRKALSDLGAVPARNPFNARGRRGRGWVLRNHTKWAKATTGELASEASSVGIGEPLQILIDAKDGV